jgi:hypothetical protein
MSSTPAMPRAERGGDSCESRVLVLRSGCEVKPLPSENFLLELREPGRIPPRKDMSLSSKTRSGVGTVLDHRRTELDDLGLRLVLGPGGLLARCLGAQETEVDEVRFDLGRWLFRMLLKETARQRRREAARHGIVCSGAHVLVLWIASGSFQHRTVGRSLGRAGWGL